MSRLVRPVVGNKKYGLRSGVYVGRPSRWGNPWSTPEDGPRTEVIERYARWLLTQPDLLAALPELAGHHLVCWCAPLPCHADVLLFLSNGNIEANIASLRKWAESTAGAGAGAGGGSP